MNMALAHMMLVDELEDEDDTLDPDDSIFDDEWDAGFDYGRMRMPSIESLLAMPVGELR